MEHCGAMLWIGSSDINMSLALTSFQPRFIPVAQVEFMKRPLDIQVVCPEIWADHQRNVVERSVMESVA